MSFIRTITDAEANPRARELFDAERTRDGYVWNLTRILAQRPEALDAWRALIGSIRSGMDLRRYELVTLAAAARSFFSKLLDAVGVQPDAAYGSLDAGLRTALTVGRPIAAMEHS